MNKPVLDPEVSRLNADIPRDLKIRLDVFCAQNRISIKEATSMALESFLDEMTLKGGVT